jgi:hypothetical protein
MTELIEQRVTRKSDIRFVQSAKDQEDEMMPSLSYKFLLFFLYLL